MVLIKKLLVFKGIVLQKYNIDKQLQALILIKFIISNFFSFFFVYVCVVPYVFMLLNKRSFHKIEIQTISCHSTC